MKKILFVLLCLASVGAGAKDVTSPNGKLVVNFGAEKGYLSYGVSYDGQYLFCSSTPDIHFKDTPKGVKYYPMYKIKSQKTVRETITPTVPTKYRKYDVMYTEVVIASSSKEQVIFRIYDDAVAYRHVTDFTEKEVTVTGEDVRYTFAKDDRVLFPKEESFYTHQERKYVDTMMSGLTDGEFCSPAMLVFQDSLRILLTEVDLASYPGIYYRVRDAKKMDFDGIFSPYPLRYDMTSDRDVKVGLAADYMAVTAGKRSYPWRVAVITSDKGLIGSGTLYSLAEPSRIDDTSWIKPGKVAWDWWTGCNLTGVDFKAGVNTQTYQYYIDFAAAHKLEYVVLDEGWYYTDGDGSVLDVVDEIDMPVLARYAQSKGVGLILWTTWLALNNDMDAAMAQFQKWGIKGIKVDFMQRDDQPMVEWYYSTAAKAAAHKLMVDYHGSYKPTGLSRTYPNVMTSEGVYGGEQNKWVDDLTPTHNLTLPFIRMALGPMDYTPGAMRNGQPEEFNPSWFRPMAMGTRCHQLGMYVVYESPLQMLADSPTVYQKEPSMMEFLSDVPAVWDSTVVLDAKIGEYVVVARKSGDKWFIGAMNAGEERIVKIPTDFLPTGGAYQIKWWTDGVNVGRNAQDYTCIESVFDAGEEFTVKLAANGGLAAIVSQSSLIKIIEHR